MKNNALFSWFSENFLNIIILVGGLIFAWAVLNSRVNAIEKRVEGYPSADYFDLKFENIQNSLSSHDKKIDDLQKQITETNLLLKSHDN